MRARVAGWLRRRADQLDAPACAEPGLEEPLQVALRMVIAATREHDPGQSLMAAHGVLSRTTDRVAMRAALHLAVIAAATGGTSREALRRSLTRLLTDEVWAELVAALEGGSDE
ncbi:hypothetical protein [Aeromicrobium sp. CnD17-E]|uniref:hypothetical protein n=1 Tax=Aeromicrobium sp. CnD17-E TaxID=2954487 RepID=UPI00209779AB|nr:hypothetical protein [Aeromicrobium sp. CnD17-E]MCO7238403.1 hypothetical protein [Aeromicrobium sp. CnD17-E]